MKFCDLMTPTSFLLITHLMFLEFVIVLRFFLIYFNFLDMTKKKHILVLVVVVSVDFDDEDFAI